MLVQKFAYYFTGEHEPIIPMLKTEILHLCILAFPPSSRENFINLGLPDLCELTATGLPGRIAALGLPYYYNLINSHQYPSLVQTIA